MKQIAIIGLGNFGIRMLEELSEITSEIIIIDKDREIIEKYKDSAKDAFITDAINETALKKIIPCDIDAVIVDLGGKIEFSIMATNYLHKIGVKKIIAKAQTDEHGEVLTMVGATMVVFPDYEAAKRITPLLASNALFNYMPISSNLSLAEVRIEGDIIGKTLIEANIRKNYELNIVAFREESHEEFTFIPPDYIFCENHILLVAGSDKAISRFSEEKSVKAKTDNFKRLFDKMFPNKHQ